MEAEIKNIALLKKNLSNEERMQFDAQFLGYRKNPNVALILGLIFIITGLSGLDRFYIGNTGLGIGKLLTLGGLGVWAIIDWFLIMGATRRKNSNIAHEIHDSIIQMR